MKLPPTAFWTWFRGFAERLPKDDVPNDLQDELLSQLHCFDDRLYFLLSTNAVPHELIITAEGNADAFSSADKLVDAAPTLVGWQFLALKPAMGFVFQHTDGEISLDVSALWFMPTNSSDDPPQLGVIIGFPDADFVLENQSVDTAYTILETGIGERSCMSDIQRVTVDDLPDDPESHGYIPLPQLADYIAFHKRRYKVE
ncbi:hypothetical protein [Leptothoe sp. PORK10 BA2]|uniref:hypothetical protein n=1 Tax=Leptothoe sp. PORK10 BA2 TaxID=3110254 RepID=UPI002B21914E|nr:hypothetical protein [Leptothoe sp. PORK10 BA2]MEA5466493.1 hypothetical protein [Leptothoe sp. PORK10 BA2]